MLIVATKKSKYLNILMLHEYLHISQFIIIACNFTLVMQKPMQNIEEDAKRLAA